jgi:hypothetical protein
VWAKRAWKIVGKGYFTKFTKRSAHDVPFISIIIPTDQSCKYVGVVLGANVNSFMLVMFLGLSITEYHWWQLPQDQQMISHLDNPGNGPRP